MSFHLVFFIWLFKCITSLKCLSPSPNTVCSDSKHRGRYLNNTVPCRAVCGSVCQSIEAVRTKVAQANCKRDSIFRWSLLISYSQKVRHYLKQHEKKEPTTFIWDRVNLCPMRVPWSIYMKVSNLWGVKRPWRLQHGNRQSPCRSKHTRVLRSGNRK